MSQVLSAEYILDSTGIKAGVAEADASLAGLGGSVDDLSKDLDDKTSTMGRGFESLGNTLGNFGLPFAASITGMGERLDEAKVKGTGYLGIMNDLATVAGGVVVAGFAAASVEALKLGVNYERSETQLAGAAGISVNAANSIGNALLDTGGKSIYTGQQMLTALIPVSAQLGTLQGHALSASQSVKFMATAGDLAEASNTSLSSATSTLASVMQSFQVPVAGASKVSDELYETSKLTGTGLDQLGSTVDRLHSRLGVATPTVGSLGTLLVDLGEHGVQGSRGLMVVNTALTTLLKPTTGMITAQTNLKNAQDALPPSLQNLAAGYLNGSVSMNAATTATKSMSAAQDQAWTAFTAADAKAQSSKQAYADLGISVTNAKGQFVGMGSIIDQLGPKLKGMSQAQQLATLTTLFGASASKALLQTILAGPGAYAKAQAAVETHDSAEKAAAKENQSLGKEMEILGSSLVDLATKWGTMLTPIVKVGAHALADVVGFFEHNRAAAIALGVVVGGVLAAAVGVFAVNMGVRLVGSVTKATSSLASLAGRFKSSGESAAESAAGSRDLAAAQDAVVQAQEEAAAATSKVNQSQAQLADAMVQRSQAQQSYTAAVRKSRDALVQLQAAQDELAGSSGTAETAAAEQKLAAAQDEVSAATDKETAAAQRVVAAKQEYSEANAGLSSSLKEQQGASAGLAEANDVLTDSQSNLARANGVAAVSFDDLVSVEQSQLETSATIASNNDVIAASSVTLEEAQSRLPAAFAATGAAEEEFGEASEAAGDAADSAFGPVGLIIMGLVTVGTLVVSHWKAISHDLSVAWDAVSGFAKKIFGGVEDFFKKWGVDVLLAFLPVVGIPVFLATHWHQVESDAKSIFGDVLSFFKHWGTDLLLAFLPVVGIPVFLATHWHEVESDAKAIWGDVVSFITGIPSKILAGLASLAGSLETFAIAAWHSFLDGVEAGEALVQDEVVTIPEKVLAWLGDAGSWLLTTGENALKGLWNGIISVESWLASQLGKIPGWLTGALAAAGTWLLSTGGQVLQGLWNGITAAWSALGDVATTISGWFTSAISNAASWLYGIGKSVIDGLWNGMKAAWGDVTGWLGGLAGDIAKFKGPIEYDATILVPHGNAIMGGLQTGLQQGYEGKVVPYLKSVAGLISGQAFGPSAATAGSALAATTGSGALMGAPSTAVAASGGVVNNYTFNVAVAGNVATENDLTNAIWRGFLLKATVNGSAGQLSMPSAAA